MADRFPGGGWGRGDGRYQNARRGNNRGRGVHGLGGGRGNQGAPRGPRPEKEVRIGYHKLMEFAGKDAEELLQIASNKNSGIPWQLQQQSMKNDFIKLLLTILAKSCSVENSPATLVSFLTMLRFSVFFKEVLLPYLSGMMMETDTFQARQLKEPLTNSLIIFKSLLSHMPSSVKELVPVTATVDLVIRNMRASGHLVDCREIDKLSDEIVELRERCLAQRSVGNNEADREKEESQPPDNFRDVSIFPTTEDIHTDELPFLRANKVKGQYNDLNHYLDVQFRLLREDFLGPLRDGINEFLQHRVDTRHRFKDIRLYQGVQVLNPVCRPTGIAYRIRFDAKQLKRVKWESTRRLIYGSLVCLSRDDFRTHFFATVANRTAKSLSQGELEVIFHNDHLEVSSIPPDHVFLMAETQAYFEAYRHVLSGLQQIGEDFPFQRHLIHCNPAVQNPRYFAHHRSPKYDLRCLVDENCVQVTAAERTRVRLRALRVDPGVESDSDSDTEDPIPTVSDIRIESKSVGSSALKEVKLLETSIWPKADLFLLDSSQREALIAALTRELVLIQGPPGTGKTFLGLKIVKALIHNRSVWDSNGNASPILVVCYTNHALDQFLEGIATFLNKGIIRVGGRCKSEILEPFMLNKQRRAFRDNHETPRHLRDGRFDSWNEMERCKERIEQITVTTQSLDNGLVHEKDLEQYISDDHFENLTQAFTFAHDRARGDQPRGFTIFYHWLGLDGTVVMEPNNEAAGNGQAAANAVEEREDNSDEELIDIEDEVEKEAQERMTFDTNENTNLSEQREKQRQKELQRNADHALGLQLSQLQDDEDDNTEGGGGWTTVKTNKKKTKNKMRKMVKRELISHNCMTEEEVGNVADLWGLYTPERWRLYRYWVSLLRRALKDKVRGEEENYHRASERHREVLEDEDRLIMEKARILGMTTTCAARYRRTLQQVRPKVIIVEEAAEVLEAHIVTTLSPGCEHVILIGDHQQLRPNPNVYKLAEKYNLKISLFERLIMNGIPCKTLERQHRMRPEISKLMQHIYPGLQDHESVHSYEDIRGILHNMYFISHSHAETADDEMKSRSNLHEANYVAQLCWYLMLQGYTPEQITILTPYTGQLLAIKRFMPKQLFEGVRVTAVDNFQGEENDIIILSLVRSNNEGSIGFLKEDNRVCVALSRAKKGFYAIGNFELFATLTNLWSKVVQTLTESGRIGPGVRLYCQNHPETGIDARLPTDFQKAPEGGCQLPCDTRLDCGHVCSLVCHTYDTDHQRYKCTKPCSRTLCELGHKCAKVCHAQCGQCMVHVDKVIPRCFHHQKVPCSTDPRDFICQMKCQTNLHCGHSCQNPCGDAHTVKCMTTIKKELKCGHVVEVYCFEENTDIECPKPCSAKLACGHPCRGTCGKCFQGRLHMPCSNGNCGRILVCGHECKDFCTAGCPPCTARCENRCNHSRCSKKCGQPCKGCMEPCAWHCRHYRCTQLCYQPCDRRRCDRPCEKDLRCGHPCIGLCGEPCPKPCRVCDKDVVETIFFGDEDEPNARFIELEDCGHIVEVAALDRWMETAPDKTGDNGVNIQLKVCPICKTSIRRNLRYGNLIKAALRDIEKVKEKMCGTREDILEMRMQVDTKLLHLNHGHRNELQRRLENEHLQLQEVTALVNAAEFLRSLTKSDKDLDKIKKQFEILRDGSIKKLTTKLQEFILSQTRFSEQTVAECRQELNRVRILIHVESLRARAIMKRKSDDSEISDLLTKCRRVLKPTHIFNGENVAIVRDCIKALEKLLPSSGLGITEEERIDIVKAVGLDKGHWYKCANGHVYAIGECGGAMVESKCPECNATIGGRNHALTGGNQHAGEMDGSRHAAWSDAANMDNYDRDEIRQLLDDL